VEEDGKLRKLYEFSFTTSRFEDFRSMIEAGSDADTQRVSPITHHLSHLTDFGFQPREPKVLSDEEKSEIEQTYERHGWHSAVGEDLFSLWDPISKQSGHVQLDLQREAEHNDHQRLRDLLATGPYQQPMTTEVFELRDDTDHFGFLLQFVEPVDWNRVLLTATLTRTELQESLQTDHPESEFSLVRNRDSTAAFLKFKTGVKVIIEDVWVYDYLDRTPFDRFRWLDRPIEVSPPSTVPEPEPPGRIRRRVSLPDAPRRPAPQRIGVDRPGPIRIRLGESRQRKRQGKLSTLFSIIPAMGRLTIAWIHLVAERFLGRQLVERERHIELDDLRLLLTLDLTFTFTRNYHARMSDEEWTDLAPLHPELQILTKQGDDSAQETGSISAVFDHLEEAS
jgi:hypothetical protein